MNKVLLKHFVKLFDGGNFVVIEFWKTKYKFRAKVKVKKAISNSNDRKFSPSKTKTFFPKNFPVLAINYFDKISSIASRK